MIPVIDMHCDTIAVIYSARHRDRFEKDVPDILRSEGEPELRSNNLMLDLERMKKAGYMGQCFALFSDLEMLRRKGISPYEYTCALSDLFDEQMEDNADMICPVTSGTEMEKNFAKGRMSALKTIEEGGAFEGSLAKLEDMYKRGVRKATLTWNYENELAYPNPSAYDSRQNTYSCTGFDTVNGLKKKGFEFVSAMEAMGMIIDISHLNDAGIKDVFNTVKPSTPVVASHSDARGICGHPRNLSDDMLRAIAEHGGVAGLNYAPSFLSEENRKNGGQKSRISDMIRQLKYMKNVAGIDSIGLGSDFDGIGGDLELSGVQDLPKLADAMRLSGFSTEEIEKVFYKNVLRVYKDVLG